MITFTPHASSSAGCAYTVSCPGAAPLLLECGISFPKLQRATGFKLSTYAGCLVSHAHGDHSRATRKLLGTGTPVCASHETWMQLRKNQGAILHDGWNWWNWWTVPENLRFAIGPWLCIGFPVRHDVETPGVFGYVVDSPCGDRLIFMTDLSYSSYRLPSDTNILAVECNFDEDILRSRVADKSLNATVGERTIRTHMSVQRLEQLLRESDLPKLREVHLLHLSDGNSDEADFKQRVQRLTGAVVKVAKA